MRSRDLSAFLPRAVVLVALGAAGGVGAQGLGDKPQQGYGNPITEADLALWDIAIETPTGDNLPAGSGSVAEGEEVYVQACEHCHGPEARGGEGYMYGTLVGGIGTMTEDPRVLTPGSMYPYAPILFDYVRRAMPLDYPQSLTADQVYAVTAYLYHLNGLVEEDFIADAETLAAIDMPNRDAFITDDRPDTANERCMQDCDPIRTLADVTGAGEESADEAAEPVEAEEIGGGGTGGQVEMGTDEQE